MSGEELEDLFGGDDQHAEHQVQEHLFAAADTDGLPAVGVMQMGEDPLDARPEAIPQVFGRDDVDGVRPDPVPLHRQDPGPDAPDLVLAQVQLDKGPVSKRNGLLEDVVRVVGAVRQIVEVRERSACLLHHRDGDLRIVQAGGRKERRQRDVAVPDGEMELVAAPLQDAPLAVQLSPPVADRGQLREVRLGVPAALLERPPVAGRPDGLLPGSLRSALARIYRRRVVADMEHPVPADRLRCACGQHVRGNAVLRKSGKRAGEGGFVRNVPQRLPSAQPPERGGSSDDLYIKQTMLIAY